MVYSEMYSKELMRRFRHPKNYGEIKNYSGLGKVENPACGDILWLYIKVKKNKKGEEIIDKIKFKTMGCPAAISVSDMVCDLAKGKTIKEAKKITNKLIAEKLQGLPKIKYHCSLLGEEALHKAIKDYKNKELKNKKNRK